MCVALEGYVAQGDSIEELRDALNLYIQEPADSKFLASLLDSSIKILKAVLEVGVDLHRIKNQMTQQEEVGCQTNGV